MSDAVKVYTVDEYKEAMKKQSELFVKAALAGGAKHIQEIQELERRLERRIDPTNLVWMAYESPDSYTHGGTGNLMTELAIRALELLKLDLAKMHDEEDAMYFRSGDTGVLEDGAYDHMGYLQQGIKDCKQFLKDNNIDVPGEKEVKQ
jgi:hypothetical protein